MLGVFSTSGAGSSQLLQASLVELIGSALLVYVSSAVAVGFLLDGAGHAAGVPGAGTLAIALAYGSVLAALVGTFRHVSGAHFNPALSIGLAVIGRFSWRAVPSYLFAQLVGAVLGSLATWVTYGDAARSKALLAAPFPAAGVVDGRAVLVEAYSTYLLVLVSAAALAGRRASNLGAGLSVGLALVAAVLVSGPVTGGAVNPVRALGPEILSGTFVSFWVYLLGPIAGGIVAAVTCERLILFRRGDEEPAPEPG